MFIVVCLVLLFGLFQIPHIFIIGVISILVLTFIVYMVQCSKLTKITNDILASIRRIVECSLESKLADNSFVFMDCYNHNDKYFYFSVEIYDDDISYDTVASIAEPITVEINSIIHEDFIPFYRIERSEYVEFI